MKSPIVDEQTARTLCKWGEGANGCRYSNYSEDQGGMTCDKLNPFWQPIIDANIAEWATWGRTPKPILCEGIAS